MILSVKRFRWSVAPTAGHIPGRGKDGMPSRILRDGILRSRRVFYLSPQAEVFYRRLMSVVDDFGRYYADPTLLLSDCFPLRPSWADEPSMSLWIAECEQANLIYIYDVTGTIYLEIDRFNQRLRDGQCSKFPEPAGNSRGTREKSAFARATTTPPTTTTHTAPTPKEKTALSENQQIWFSEFWAAYWRRIGRGAAETSFAKLVTSQASFDRVMQAIALQAPWMAQRDSDKRPYPATWLNQKRWEDDPDVISSNGKHMTAEEMAAL